MGGGEGVLQNTVPVGPKGLVSITRGLRQTLLRIFLGHA